MDGWLGLNPENTDLGGKLLGHHDPDHRLVETKGNSPPSRLPQVQASLHKDLNQEINNPSFLNCINNCIQKLVLIIET